MKGNNKIKVLQVSGAMNRGGAEVMLMDIYRNISGDFHFDFLINYNLKNGIVKGDFDDEILQRGGSINHIPAQWDIGPIRYIKKFKKIIKKIGLPDVIHIHMNAKSGIIALAAKKVGIKKIIVHSHADLKFRGSVLKNIFNKLELIVQRRLINNNATDFWGASAEANKSLFYKAIANQKALVINNAVNVDKIQNISLLEVQEFKEEHNISNDTLVLGNIGRVVRHKNVDFVIDVLNQLKASMGNFVFLFAGRNDDEKYFSEIQEKITAYDLSDKVIYLGDRSDVNLIYNVLDVFVAPALREGFGLVAVEAQAAGVPCVLYKGFPKTVDMNLDLVTILEDFEIENWTEVIKNKSKKNENFKQIKKVIVSKGFDSKSNTIRIEGLYKSN